MPAQQPKGPRTPNTAAPLRVAIAGLGLIGQTVAEMLDAGVPGVQLAAIGVRDVENLLHLPGTPAPASRPKLVRERART